MFLRIKYLQKLALGSIELYYSYYCAWCFLPAEMDGSLPRCRTQTENELQIPTGCRRKSDRAFGSFVSSVSSRALARARRAFVVFSARETGEAQAGVQQAQVGARRGGHRLHQRQKQTFQQEDQACVRQVYGGNQTKPREGDGPLRRVFCFRSVLSLLLFTGNNRAVCLAKFTVRGGRLSWIGSGVCCVPNANDAWVVLLFSVLVLGEARFEI